jgi:hypothetical protein
MEMLHSFFGISAWQELEKHLYISFLFPLHSGGARLDLGELSLYDGHMRHMIWKLRGIFAMVL